MNQPRPTVLPGWLLLAGSVSLLAAAVWLAIDAVPHLMAANTMFGPFEGRAGSRKLMLSLLCALGAATCASDYRKRFRAGSSTAESVPGWSVGSRRRWIWITVALMIAFFAWNVFWVQCPAQRALETLIPAEGGDGSGQSICWKRFLLVSALAVLLGTGADVLVRRRSAQGKL